MNEPGVNLANDVGRRLMKRNAQLCEVSLPGNTSVYAAQSALFLLMTIFLFLGCQTATDKNQVVITLWHQMTVNERKSLDQEVARFHAAHPEIRVNTLYKETEELRSGFQAAALAGSGPQLVYGPADSLGAFVTMGIVQDMSPWFNAEQQSEFLEAGLIHLAPPKQPDQSMLVQVGDRLGNHLALVYNRNLIKTPPKTTDEMVKLAKAATLDRDNDGRIDQYGLVWNFVEPFFAVPFLTGHGAWVFDESGEPRPNLDTPECVSALKFLVSLQKEHRVLPANCDYETADALFKDGSAAMIINGDWSWSDYLANPKLDAAIAPMPIVSSTGKPMGPMVAPKGYSLNVHAEGERREAAMTFVRFMTSAETQRNFMSSLKTLPSRKSLLDDPLLTEDRTLMASAQQIQNGRAMPVVPEMRAVWDAMRPPYQALLAGNLDASQAAKMMQADSLSSIERMNRQLEPTAAGAILKVVAGLLAAILIWTQRRACLQLAGDWQKNRLAYLLITPSILVIVLTIVYPFFYNIVLSFSNMSLRNFQDWQIVGWQNYEQIFLGQDSKFLTVLLKTVIWTVVCVFFHVAIGLMLAVALNGPIRGKSVYRILLILPWAIPAYITALTWRGMFDYEYGAVNAIASQFLGLTPINWLGDEINALVACIVTNIWLGFPFMMVIALGGMQGIPREMYEAAQMDRVSRWGQFWNITLPMLKPVLIPAVTLGTIWTFNNLNVVWLVSNSGEPSDKTHILVSYVYKAVFNLYQYGYGAALSIVIFFMLLIFSMLFLSRSRATEGVS